MNTKKRYLWIIGIFFSIFMSYFVVQFIFGALPAMLEDETYYPTLSGALESSLFAFTFLWWKYTETKILCIILLILLAVSSLYFMRQGSYRSLLFVIFAGFMCSIFGGLFFEGFVKFII